MSLTVNTRIPAGNAAAVTLREDGECPEVRFSSDPRHGATALWFCFRLADPASEANRQGKVRLTWEHVDSVPGGVGDPAGCRPVFQPVGHAWTRLKHGEKTLEPDGRIALSWMIPYPAPATDVALCFPYGTAELDWLRQHYGDYWAAAEPGISGGGRPIVRLFNNAGAPGGTHPGLYLVARQHAGETPGSWVLEGFLQHLAQIRKAGYVVWAVPLADPDGVADGSYGRGALPGDFDAAWGPAPGRHAVRVLRDDLKRWKGRCRPILALDIQAPGAFEQEGVYALAGGDPDGATAAEETKWCNVLRTELQAQFAAPEFKRNAPAGADIGAFLRADLGVPALRLMIPYSQAGETLLTQKLYREIGRRLALGVLRRHP